MPHLLPYSCAKAAVGALAEGLYAEAARDGVSVTAVHPGLMRTGSHLHALFAGDRRREFAWFSALAGTPLISMDAHRAANRIVTAVQRRRVRLVLTPAARRRRQGPRARPRAHHPAQPHGDHALAGPRGPAHSTPRYRRGADLPRTFGERLRSVGSALNDRAALAYNERHRVAPERDQP